MITLRSVSLWRGAKRLLESADLTIVARQRVGVTGANGSGKSSLFALLRGEIHAEAGGVELPPGTRIAWVVQETPTSTASALDYALDGDRELQRVEAEIATAQHAHDLRRLSDLHARYDELDGYSARARAAQILDG